MLQRVSGQPGLTIDWLTASGIAFYHAIALLALFPYFFSWTAVVVAGIAVFVFGTIGINIFYHRYLTHKGFRCPRWLECTMAVFAVCSFQDTPARWVAVHRRHHEHSDEEHDPHSPIGNFLWGHIGWILVKSPDLSRYEIYSRYAKDVLRDPFFRQLENPRIFFGIILAHWFGFFCAGALVSLISGGALSEVFRLGWSFLIWGVFVRTVFVWHTTWAVNSVGHVWGYRNYDTEEHSRNNVLVGLLSNGEGWHNNHHADPRSARHGHRWWELDVAYLTIRAFGLVGLAWRITEPQPRKAGTRSGTYLPETTDPELAGENAYRDAGTTTNSA